MLPHQLRYVVRKLVHSPMFTGIALLTLALAIGANTVVFSVVNGVLIKPLPFEDPDRLVGVWHTAPGLGFDEVNQSPALHFTYLEEGESFDAPARLREQTRPTPDSLRGRARSGGAGERGGRVGCLRGAWP